jgi:voltage-gated potassium channel
VRESRVRLASRSALLAVGSAAILIVAAAVMELDVERAAAKANITTFSDALRWAVSTVATVGYGDHYPVTPAGRAIGIMLMVAGVGIFGVTAAAAAAWFVKADQEEDRQQQTETITALTAEITALREAISEVQDALPKPDPSQRLPRQRSRNHADQPVLHGSAGPRRGGRSRA